jgi:hypothetical protein
VVDVQTFLEGFFEHVAEICLYHWWNFFCCCKKQKFSLGSACLKSWIIRISELLGIRLKEFHCVCIRVCFYLYLNHRDCILSHPWVCICWRSIVA